MPRSLGEEEERKGLEGSLERDDAVSLRILLGIYCLPCAAWLRSAISPNGRSSLPVYLPRPEPSSMAVPTCTPKIHACDITRCGLYSYWPRIGAVETIY